MYFTLFLIFLVTVGPLSQYVVKFHARDMQNKQGSSSLLEVAVMELITIFQITIDTLLSGC